MEEERRLLNERKRNILLLIHQYLKDNGMFYTSASLEREAQYNAKDYQLCDNVDLDSIYLEYISYFNLKFGKSPKIVKKSENIQHSQMRKSQSVNLERQATSNGQKKNDDRKATKIEDSNLNASLVIVSMNHQTNGDKSVDTELPSVRRRLSDCEFFINSEWREMAEVILRDLVRPDSFNIKWSEIVGQSHTHAKVILTESTILPLQYPDLFSAVGNSWKCTLLHGPPGTGKSALAKGLLSETKHKFNFFNVSSSTITSKWRGDSEKFIRVLFDVAKFYAPSIVLFEEIDGLTSCRDVYEHESAKRFKNEFLAQIDGLHDVSSNICILGTTNLPWDIDPAFLRRFEQKLLIGLPSNEDRMKLIQNFLPLSKHWSNTSKIKLSDLTKGLTGDEIRIGCKEATMKKIRQAISMNESHSAGSPNVISHPKVEPVTDADAEKIFEKMQPTSNLLLEKHVQWSRQYNK